jgi:hypothetical protein
MSFPMYEDQHVCSVSVCNALFCSQADVAESLAQARQMGIAAKQRAALAEQRVAAVRTGEAAAALGVVPGAAGGGAEKVAGKAAARASASSRCALCKIVWAAQHA